MLTVRNTKFSSITKLLVAVILSFNVMNTFAKVRVTDETSGQPLPKASIFDKNGIFIAVTDEQGYVPENISKNLYPLHIRYVGYEPLSVASPNIGSVTMVESSYTLPELLVNDQARNILYLQAYVREYYTGENSKDTVATFVEQVVDYAIPIGKAKYKGWKKPRALAQQEYKYLRIEKKKTSVDTMLYTNGGKMRTNNFNIAQKFKVPECILSGDSTESVIYGKYYPKERWTVSGNYYIFDHDEMADYKDHYFQPGFMKLLGLTAGMSLDEQKYVFEKGSKKGASAENLVEASETFDLIMKGKLIKKATEQNEDTKMSYFTEMFVIDRAYLTADEAKDLKKNPPVVDILTFQVPQGIPAPPAEVISLKDAVLKSTRK